MVQHGLQMWSCQCISFTRLQWVNTLMPRQIAIISQMTFSNAFAWMKMYEFHLRFPWSLFLSFKLTIFQHWFRYRLGTDQAASHYLNQWWLVYWHICASLSLNELTHWQHACASVELDNHWFRYWLVGCVSPNHYPNQCWLIVDWTLWNKNFTNFKDVY